MSILGINKEPERTYEFFQDPRAREDLYTIASRMGDYIHTNKIDNLVLIDRASRPAYLGLMKYWHAKYPEQPLPNIYFLNPFGMTDKKYWMSENGLLLLLDSMQKDNFVSPNDLLDSLSQTEIQSQFRTTYEKLYNSRDQNTMLFDTCIHTGEAMRPIATTMLRMGFNHLKVGVASNTRNDTIVRPDFVAVNGNPTNYCYPFHHDRMVVKTVDKPHSTVNPDSLEREQSTNLRREISQIMDQKLVQHGIL